MTPDEHSIEAVQAELLPNDAPTIILNEDGSPAFAVLRFAAYRHLLDTLLELREDLADQQWARNYAQRKAAGTLTEDERETISIDDLIVELAPGWTDKT